MISFIYLVDEFFFLFLNEMAHWVNPRYYLFVSGVSQGNQERRWEKGSFPSELLRVRWHNLVCVCIVFVDDETNGDWFLLYWGLVRLWVMSVAFENTYTVSGKWNVSRAVARPYGWVYKTIRLSPLAFEHNVMVKIVGSQFGISVLLYLCVESVGP